MAETNKSFKEQSRISWMNNTNSKATIEEIQTGALQRIADATEVMAKSYNDLIRENQCLKQQKLALEREANTLRKSNAAYRGQITKLKKQLP